ncbi:Beta-1,4-N-acetylgalactosaminyltransferase bre-4 [Lamellibrachia satsuma]|nr:Beta-1,4-N-acetylgalactosaminyltransferase bre-4 [Lamellibrachia satsuma]
MRVIIVIIAEGRLSVYTGLAHNITEAEVIRNNPEILPGGKWRPRDCVARHKVALIIPYRDREDHLILLLSQLHPILQRQQLDYRIVVVEQFGADTFNKARIMNIGFMEALKLYDFQCFIFHDVDLVPEDDRNMYSCPVQPRHMSVAIDEMGYK